MLHATAWHESSASLLLLESISSTKQYCASLRQALSQRLDISWHQNLLCKLVCMQRSCELHTKFSPAIPDKANWVLKDRLWIRLPLYCRVKDFGQKVAADDHEASRDSLAQLSKSLMFFQNWVRSQLKSKPDVQQSLLLQSRLHFVQNSISVYWQSRDDNKSVMHSEKECMSPLSSCDKYSLISRSSTAACPRSRIDLLPSVILEQFLSLFI